MRGIKVHSLQGDWRTTQVKSLLEHAGATYDEVDVTGQHASEPQVFVDGQEVGGYETLLQLESEDRLAAVLGFQTGTDDEAAQLEAEYF